MKAKLKLLILLVSFFIVNSSVYGADILNIVPKDLQNINFEISPKVPLLKGKVFGEVKVLKDLQIISSSKDFKDSNKIILNLKDSLIPNRSYNLLAVFGVDGNIDFTLGSEFKLLDIKNPDNVLGIQGITRIFILDSRTIEVYFNNPIDATEFEFKLFRETLTNKLTNSGSTLSINLKEKLDKSSNYILMMISLNNKYGIDIKFNQEIYDFVTSTTLGDKNITNSILKNVKKNQVLTSSGELSNVALNSAANPKSGPETWILIFLTLMINIVLFIKKKIIR